MPLLPTGKLPADLLQAVLDKHARHDPRVVVGPRVGEDAAVIDMGDRYLVATSRSRSPSPPTSSAGTRCTSTPTTSRCAGRVRAGSWPRCCCPRARPTRPLVRTLFAPARRGVRGAGGRPGRRSHRGDARARSPDRRRHDAGRGRQGQAGDDGRRPGGRRRSCSPRACPWRAPPSSRARRRRSCARAACRPRWSRGPRRFCAAPGISVLPEAEIACELASVHAMHDPTEGGVATALHELADAAGVGLRIDQSRITVLPEGARAVRGLRPRPARHASRRGAC